MRIVPRAPGPLDAREAARALQAAFVAVGALPTLRMAEILLAQIHFETAGHPNNNNPGNLMAAGFSNGAEISGWSGDAWRPPWFADSPELSPRMQAIRANMLAGEEPSAFRSYPTLAAGFSDWLALLAHRFPRLLEAAAAGDLAAFSREYTGHPGAYMAHGDPHETELALTARRAELRAAGAFDGIVWAPPPPLAGSGKAGPEGPIILGAVALASVALLWFTRRAPGTPRTPKAPPA